MEEVINLILPFFSTATDLAQTLKRLASFAFYETYIITLTLRSNPEVNRHLAHFENWGAIGKVVAIIPHHEVLNLSGIAIALVVAILTHMLHFHDRISDVFGIRRRFDRIHILVPLAKCVGSSVTIQKIAAIKAGRDQLMHKVFYRYASSRDDHPLVDKHDIEHAMNAWSWFWVCIEAAAYFMIGAIIAWQVGSPDIARAFAIVVGGVLLVGGIQRLRLPGYARPQIEQIAADKPAAANARKHFDAL
jgi:hypothetical protein